MEDILASIRRILNEDEAASPGDGAAATAPAGPATAAGEPEPLLLTEDMMVTGTEDPASPEAKPAAAAPEAPSPAAPVPVADALLAPAAAAAASASVGELLRAVSSERGTMVSRTGPTIEDVVREELRPLLKDWLDRHLPAIVERVVRAEIERLAGRA